MSTRPPNTPLSNINSLTRMRSGKWHIPVGSETAAERQRTAELLKQLNELANTDPQRSRLLIQELTQAEHASAFIMAPAHIEYGCNVQLGRDVFINNGVTVLSSAKVRIGDRSMVAPQCQFITINHPVNDLEMRRAGWEKATPITVGEDCWIGAGVIVMPGVTIGSRSVIGAGALVTKDIPEDSLALGAPAKVIRTLNEQESPQLERYELFDEGLPLDPQELVRDTHSS